MYPTTISVAGDFGSGKDEVARILVEDFGYTRFAFGDALKEEEQLVLNSAEYRDFVWDQMPLTARDAVLTCLALGYLDPFAKPTTPEMRELHQRYGTDFRRWCTHMEYWIQRTEEKIGGCARVVFSDLRFKDELKAVRRRKGLYWKVVRTGTIYAGYDPGLAAHISEHDLDGERPDSVIPNYGTLDDLRKLIHMDMRHLNLMAA